MTLYITADCSTCTQVREALDELALAHETVVLPAGGKSDRLPEGTQPPALVDDGRVIQGAGAIFVYLEELEELKRVWLKYQSDVCYCD
jgi:glutathione S-transferase